LAGAEAAGRGLAPDLHGPERGRGRLRLEAFDHGPWGTTFPTVVAAWRRAWTHVMPCFAFPPDVRRVIDTTHALESVHARLRKIIKTRGHFPNAAAIKLIWLALRNNTTTWGGRGANYWREVMHQFAVLYEERFTTPRVSSTARVEASTRILELSQRSEKPRSPAPYTKFLTPPIRVYQRQSASRGDRSARIRVL
jgi:hypothetical protein